MSKANINWELRTLRVLLTDNDPFDIHPVVGVIRDLVVLCVPVAPVMPGSSSGNGSCSIASNAVTKDPSLLILAGLAHLGTRRRRMASLWRSTNDLQNSGG